MVCINQDKGFEIGVEVNESRMVHLKLLNLNTGEDDVLEDWVDLGYLTAGVRGGVEHNSSRVLG